MRPILLALFVMVLSVSALAQPVPQGIVINPESSDLVVEVWAEKPNYLSGERLNLNVRLSEDAFVYLYDINADGDITLLFPNAYDEDNFLSAGEHVFPNPRYSFVVDGDPGTELIQAIATPQPIDIVSIADRVPSRNNPFATFDLSPEQMVTEVQTLIANNIDQDLWAAGWTQFNIVTNRPNRWLIRSQPEEAEIYLDGQLLGLTPQEITLVPPSAANEQHRVELTLVKQDYLMGAIIIEMTVNARGELNVRTRHNQLDSFNRQSAGELIVLDARLRSATIVSEGFQVTTPNDDFDRDDDELPEEINFRRLSPGSMGGSLSANLGGHPDGISTFGFELGFGLLHFGMGLADTVDDVPEFFDIGEPIDFGDELILNEEPEVELYAKLSIPTLVNGLHLELGGGLIHQLRVHLASAFSSAQPSDVVVLPNGYRSEEINISGIFGVSYRANGLLLQVGYDTHRGVVGGLGLAF